MNTFSHGRQAFNPGFPLKQITCPSERDRLNAIAEFPGLSIIDYVTASQGRSIFVESIQSFLEVRVVGRAGLDFDANEIASRLLQQIDLVASAVAKEIEIRH